MLGIIQKTEIKVFCDFIVCKDILQQYIKLLYNCYFRTYWNSSFLFIKFFIMKTIQENHWRGDKETLENVWNNVESCLEFMTGSIISLINNQSHISYAWYRYGV